MGKQEYIANKNLKELRGSGFEIMNGEPDIRGWKVRNLENQVIGKVDELLFDIVSLKVRYLVVKLDGKPINLISRDLLIPIGLAELDEDDDFVLFPDVTAGHLASLPEYKKGKFTVQTEQQIRSIFGGENSVAGADAHSDDTEEFYNHDHFNEDRMYKPRKPSLEKDSQPAVREKIDNRYTTKRIVPEAKTGGNIIEVRPGDTDRIGAQHEPVTGDQTKPVPNKGSFAPFQEGSIQFVEHSEVPVISKEARVVEQVSLNKEVTERNEKVKDSVRKTEIDVEKLNTRELSSDDDDPIK
jgi:stress response protein YsnF